MLDLESAIKHCEEVADGMTEQGKCAECANEHRQLAEWLKELKQFKEQEPCEDVVSREEAIRVLKENCSHWNTNVMLIDIATDLLKKLPSVTPKRKVGEWIKKNNDYFDWYECSECGYGSDGEMKYNRLCDVRTKFCPDCGSQNLKGE